MSKLCLIYNTAPHYREAIFRKIDAEYDCDWFFGETKSDIKEMDYSVLKNVTIYKSIGNPNKLYWQRGIVSLIFKKKYDTFFMLGEVRALSCWLFWLLAFVLFPKKKIYIWTHGWYGKESGIDAKMKLWLYRHVAGVFTYGDYARQELIKLGIDEKKLFAIKNSLSYDEQIAVRNSLSKNDIYKAHFQNEHPTLLFIGRLTAVKRLDQVITAVSNLWKRGENFNLVFVGNGSEKEALQQMVIAENLEKSVWFYGACYKEEEIGNLIYNADLCVSPGNVGLTAMHSLVYGTPVITHNDFKWQMPEFEAIKEGVTGTFFEYNNVDELTDKISQWFKDNQSRREEVRKSCFNEIDTYWNPNYQIDVIKNNLLI